MRSTIKTVVVAGSAAALLASGTAGAASLITSAKIKDGTILVRDLSKGQQLERVQTKNRLAALEQKAGIPGAAGSNGRDGTNGLNGLKGDAGTKGAAGSNGSAGADGHDGHDGTNGTNGAAGANGVDGVNPARLVAKSGDQGWTFTGSPAAKLTGGELRLAGGFDGSTTAGGIGIAHAYDAPLSSLSALSYDVLVHARPNDLSAPAIHVVLMGAATGTASGFAQLVFEPYQNGGTKVDERKSIDTMTGKWWATRDLPGITRGSLASLDAIKASSPDARIVGISVDNGNTSGSGTIPADALSMGADNLVVGFGSGFDRVDFGG